MGDPLHAPPGGGLVTILSGMRLHKGCSLLEFPRSLGSPASQEAGGKSSVSAERRRARDSLKNRGIYF